MAARALTLIAAGVLAVVCLEDALARGPHVQAVGSGSLASACGETEPLKPLGLADAMAQALDQQPQLLIAEAEESASQSDLTSARAAFLPQIDFSSIEERYVP